MKRIWIVCLSLCVLLMGNLAQAEEDARIADACLVCDALLAGEYDAVTARFDETLAAAIDSATLAAGWESVVTPLGEYSARGDITSGEQSGLFVVQVTEQFADGGVLVTLAYNDEGLLSGLNLKYAASAPATAAPDANYTEEELTVAGDANYPLGATLCLPAGVEQPPVVLMVQGSGSSDRNETIGANHPFADIAHGLAAQGIATLRWDKRFYTYPEAAGTVGAALGLREEVLDDLTAAIELMRTDERVDAGRMYVLGHSLGGLLTPAIAAENPELAGVISMAGSLRPLWEIVYDQNCNAVQAAEAAGLSDEEQAMLDAQVAQVETDIAVLRGDFTALPDTDMLLGINVGYWKSLKEYWGMNFIDTVEMPMLILQGEADFQVFADKDYKLWQDTLSGRGNVVFHLYEGLNHLLMPTNGKQDVSEYMPASAVSQQAIDDIAAFVLG